MSWTPQTCRVSFVDGDGLEHAVQVVARSRNEAAIRALAEFRHMNRDNTDELIGPHKTDKLLVRIIAEQSHEVSVKEAELWLERSARGPRDILLKGELRKLFEA